MKHLFLLLSTVTALADDLPETNRAPINWSIANRNQITLNLAGENVLPYADNIEMSGKRVAGIISYEIDEERLLTLDREIYFPQLHEFKSETDGWFHDYRAYLKDSYGDDLLPKLYINKEKFVPGPIAEASITGNLTFIHEPSKSGLKLTRVLFPHTDDARFIEHWTLTNTTDAPIEIISGRTSLTYEDFGARGKFTRHITSTAPETLTLAAGENTSLSLNITASLNESAPSKNPAKEALAKREAFLGEMSSSLQLHTPDPTLDTLFEFSKIRASESIFDSELGLIHSPGGGRYYVGIWANDQAEYINPFFPYLGYETGNISAMNAFRAFAKETTPDFKNIRYSFEIEGLVKPFPKDRGDAAMIAYGAAQYALSTADQSEAKELWPLIDWCLEYCHRMLTPEGVVASESDEMEGRVETGTANLSTSALYYGALDHSIDLAVALGHPSDKISIFKQRMSALETAIDSYFGATVEGLETYKYYKEHTFLRHWICLPLVVGIHDRKEPTITALFDRLWTDNGVHVEKNSDNEKITKIFWDRGTLYALRGTFIAGATETSLAKLQQFSTKRLIGDRVPYVVEAFPEGDMAHLSAESALYCRVFLEGLFGIKPIGFGKLELTPRLPKDWPHMSLKHIKLFGRDFDLTVTRNGKQQDITITENGKTLLKTTTELDSTIEFSF